MNLLIAGASGFIGHELVKSLSSKDYHISILGRKKSILLKEFPQNDCYTWTELDNLNAQQFDVIINLCGFNISAARWTPAIKKQIIDSRVNTTKKLIEWLIQANAKPRFLCANAVGIYGTQPDSDPSLLDEDTIININTPHDFLSEIGVRWQEALEPAIKAGIPVVSTRFGVVLKKNQGMLKKLYPSFYCGLGSILGHGKQYISWVHIEDVVNSILFLLTHNNLTGPINLTSPNPVTQADFAQTLAKVLHRPLFFKMPAFLVKLIFGEMGEYLLLKGQRVIPKRLTEAGFNFKYPTLLKALEKEFC